MKKPALKRRTPIWPAIIPSSLPDGRGVRWRPRVKVFWRDARGEHERELAAPRRIQFDSEDKANNYAVRRLLTLWLENREGGG